MRYSNFILNLKNHGRGGRVPRGLICSAGGLFNAHLGNDAETWRAVVVVVIGLLCSSFLYIRNTMLKHKAQ